MIFGERGVGKTSFANTLKDIFSAEIPLVIKVNCDQGDNFSTMWHKATGEIEIVEDKELIGFRKRVNSVSRSLSENLTEKIVPDDIRRVLQFIGESIIILDEYDRVNQSKANRLMADTIKNLSDNAVNTTILLVGVADTVDDLFAEHTSIDRSLAEIEMPRMSSCELKEIVTKAHGKINATIDDNAMGLVVLLSQGLPHYTHLLGQNATKASIHNGRLNVTLDDVHSGIESSLTETKQTIRNIYQQAISSQRSDTIFKEVLLACALAEVDELGYFISASVREPLSQIMGRQYDIPGFSQHLNAFSEAGRGNILEKKGTIRRFRFRFRNPLLQPYIIMRGLSDGLLAGELRKLLETKRR
ncbi:MAG: AAA family ATPase [bacterium]